MQMWQQQLMYKQLQELQRQQQLQQLEQGARQQNPLSQFSAATKPAAVNQLPEMPINDTSNYTCPNNFVGGMPPLSNNSQMFVMGNMNWVQSSGSPAIHNVANGLILTNEQSQVMKSMGFIPQQHDQTFHGMPISGASGSGNQYPQFLVSSSDCTDLITQGAGNQAGRVSDQFSSFQYNQNFPAQGSLEERNPVTSQNLQEKGFFGNTPVQVLNNDDVLGKGCFQQASNLQSNVQVQEISGRQQQANWSDNLQEKPATQVESSTEVATLDPTEQKLLFGTDDDDDNWGASFSGSLGSCTRGYLHRPPLENDCFGAFPSIQSGSWSALMQEAVQASSSDKRLQEEWSGLSFQMMGQSMVKHTVVSNDSGKKPAAWDDNNMQSASSLTSRSLPLFDGADSHPSTHTAPIFQHSFKSAHIEDNKVQTEAARMSFPLSPGEDKSQQFHQMQKQKQPTESGLQAQMPITNGMWAAHAYQQQENCSADMQNMDGVWTHQQNVSLSNIGRQSSNRQNNWSTSYPVGSSGDNTSSFLDNSGNLWRLGGSLFNLNGGVQLVESNAGIAQMKTEDSVCNFSSVASSNTLKLNQETIQQVTDSRQVVFGKSFALNKFVNSKSDENLVSDENQMSERPQTWESSVNGEKKRLPNLYDNRNENKQVVSGEGHASNDSNHGFVSSAKESLKLAGYDQLPFAHGIQMPINQSGQQVVGPKPLQNPTANIGVNAEHSFPINHLLNFQGLPRSNIDEQTSSGNSNISGHAIPNNMGIVKKAAMGAEALKSRDSIPVNSSSSFNGSTAQYCQNSTTVQTSQNMLELLHKVDQSRNSNSLTAPDIHAQAFLESSSQFNQQTAIKGFGLRLGPPSQRHPYQNYVLPSQTSLTDSKIKQIDRQGGDRDQTVSTCTPAVQSFPYEASQRENWEKISNISGQKCNETLDSRKQLNSLSAAAPDFPYVGIRLQEQQLHHHHIPGTKNQLEQQQQHHISSSTGHETLDHEINSSGGNQANISALVNNAGFFRQPNHSHDGVVVDPSGQTPLPRAAGLVPPSRVDSIADAHAVAGSEFYSAETSNEKQTIPGSSQIQTLGQQFPILETRSGLQNSVAGMSQQVVSSNKLHNVWTGMSAQQRLAGLQPNKLTPQIIQSIINNSRDTSLWPLQRAFDQGNKGEIASDVGTGSANSQNGEEYPTKGNSLVPMHFEKVDSTAKTGTSAQWQEPVRKTRLDGGSNISVPSLVCLHQQDAEKGKKGQDSSLCSQQVLAPDMSIASSSNDVGFSGHISIPSDAQQQNYSLLHQMQVMKGADSDPSKLLGKRMRGADIGSNAPQVDWNAGQRFLIGQSSALRVPVDSKANSAPHSFPTDVKMLSFAPTNNEEKDASASPAGHVDIRNQMHSLNNSSTANLIGGNERPLISLQMAPTWFDKYGTPKNGIVMGNYDLQKINASQPFFFPKIPGSMDSNAVTEQRTNRSQVATYGHGTSVSMLTSNQSSHNSLHPILDHDIVPRPKKHKSAIKQLLPWHKMVTEGPRRFQRISMAELDWAHAASRLIEKVNDEAETTEDGPSLPQPRKRLILTTQLMQQLIPAVPARVLNVDATSSYESVTFCVAKSALMDACSLTFSLGTDSSGRLDDDHMISGELKSSQNGEELIFSKVVENFIGRSKKLESDFSRLDKRTSVLDVRLECQELERFSIVNRLGKFHGRPHSDGSEGSSTYEAASRKSFLQRYVTVLSVPANLPKGVPCLSL